MLCPLDTLSTCFLFITPTMQNPFSRCFPTRQGEDNARLKNKKIKTTSCLKEAQNYEREKCWTLRSYVSVTPQRELPLRRCGVQGAICQEEADEPRPSPCSFWSLHTQEEAI